VVRSVYGSRVGNTVRHIINKILFGIT